MTTTTPEGFFATYKFALECEMETGTEEGCMYDAFIGARDAASTDESLLVPEVVLVCRLHGTSFSIVVNEALLAIKAIDALIVTKPEEGDAV